MSRTSFYTLIAIIACLCTMSFAWSMPWSQDDTNDSKTFIDHELYYNHAQISADPLPTWSPFTSKSDYVELLVQGLPTNKEDGTKYEFSVKTRGFIAKDLVAIEFIEAYTNATTSATAQWKALAQYKSKSKEHFTFSANFNHFDSTEQDYYRGFILRFDIVEHVATATQFEIDISARADKTGKDFPFPKFAAQPFPLLASSSTLTLGSYKDHIHKDWNFVLNSTQIPLSSATSTLTLYSFFEDYYFISNNRTQDGKPVNSTQCTFGDFTVTGTLSGTLPRQFINFDLKSMTETIPKESTIDIKCPEFAVHADSKIHWSEYWVAYTPTFQHTTQYVPGENRTDKLVKWAIIIASIALVILLIIAIIITICCCKACKCCCYADRGNNFSTNGHYSRM